MRRGGNSAEIALTLRGVPGATALVMTHGAEVPNSAGLFGGWPGSTVRQRFHPDSLTPLPAGGDAGGWQQLGPKPGDLPMSPGDIFAVCWQGGGGFGDPLDRPTGHVLSDVFAGLLSAAEALRRYGVIVAGGTVDQDATARARRELRAARIGRPVADPPPRPAAGRPLGPGLVAVDGPDGVQTRTHAGAVLSRGHTRWRAGAVPAALDPGEHGITLHDDLAMTAYYCPLSGVQLAVDVHRRGEQPLDDIDLTWRAP